MAQYTVFADQLGPQPNKFPHEGDWQYQGDARTIKDARVMALTAVASGFARANIFRGATIGRLVEEHHAGR